MKIIVQCAHEVALANAENIVREVWRLARVGSHEPIIEHLEQEDVKALELMPDKPLITKARADLIHRCEAVSRRISIILHICECRLNQPDGHAVLIVRV